MVPPVEALNGTLRAAKRQKKVRRGSGPGEGGGPLLFRWGRADLRSSFSLLHSVRLDLSVSKVAFDAELLMMPKDKDVQVVLLEE
jgi:hypothetical protein